MIDLASPGPRQPRALVICYNANGGLGIATSDLGAQLADRGWDVTALVNVDGIPFSPSVIAKHELPAILPEMQHKGPRAAPELPRRLVRDGLGVDRSLLMLLRRGRPYALEISQSLTRLEQTIRRIQPDVVLLACDGMMPPGATALTLDCHSRTVILTLLGLTRELRARGWPATRLLARLIAGHAPHPYLFRRIAPEQLHMVVFASRAWMEQGIAAGVPAGAAHVIYNGVSIGPLAPRPPFRHRLLWVARLSPEKGLHDFLRALPAVRRAYPSTRLTVVADYGPQWYRRQIENLIDNLDLRDAVDILPGVPRDAVPAYYADHDVLLFASPNAEPVALVAKEAFAAGIPVVSSRPLTDSPLIQDGVTCLTYDPARIETLASAICTLLGDEPLRQQLARNARSVAVDLFSLDAMGARYDTLLRSLLPSATC